MHSLLSRSTTFLGPVFSRLRPKIVSYMLQHARQVLAEQSQTAKWEQSLFNKDYWSRYPRGKVPDVALPSTPTSMTVASLTLSLARTFVPIQVGYHGDKNVIKTVPVKCSKCEVWTSLPWMQLSPRHKPLGLSKIWHVIYSNLKWDWDTMWRYGAKRCCKDGRYLCGRPNTKQRDMKLPKFNFWGTVCWNWTGI